MRYKKARFGDLNIYVSHVKCGDMGGSGYEPGGEERFRSEYDVGLEKSVLGG